MIDIESRRVIDLLESREIEDIAKWLATYPNLQVVSRDGSIVYKSAINQSHPKAIQVNDRFHLFKNLTDYCKSYLTKIINAKIEIPNNNSSVTCKDYQYNSSDKVTRIKKVQELYRNGINKTNIKKQLKMDSRTEINILKLKILKQ